MSFSPSFPIPNNAAIVLFKEPRALAGIPARLPASAGHKNVEFERNIVRI